MIIADLRLPRETPKFLIAGAEELRASSERPAGNMGRSGGYQIEPNFIMVIQVEPA